MQKHYQRNVFLLKKINFEKKFKKYENGLTLRVNCSERLAPMIQKIYTIERLNQSLQHTYKIVFIKKPVQKLFWIVHFFLPVSEVTPTSEVTPVDGIH